MAALSLKLPFPTGEVLTYQLEGTPLPAARRKAADFPRIAYAAAHVVAEPLAEVDPWLTPAIDWDRTLAFRHHLWDLGLGVAEAMDTAQRGMGLGWPEARELIRLSLREAAGRGDALIACGAGTDHLAPGPDVTIDDILRAYESQIETVEAEGGRVILMASRALAAAARGPDDYITVYDRILSASASPSSSTGWARCSTRRWRVTGAHEDHMAAMEVALDVIAAHADKVDGIKVSLLSSEKEIAMRRRLPAGVRMYTGDDFNYAELIAGDDQGQSDALLGIFDAIAPAASSALADLGAGRVASFFDTLAPTVPLSRHIFRAPTRFYKTGIVFLAWLNGHQDHFQMIGGQQSARSTMHFAELFRLADKARCLSDPELAVQRMRAFLAVNGVD
jgi:hypothetical protein